MITGYLIDPERRTIEAVEITDRPGVTGPSDGGYQHMRELLGHGDASLDNGTLNEHRDKIWTEDQAIMRGKCFGFRILGYHWPLAGRSIIIGCDEYGESTNPWVSKDWLNEHVRFLGEIEPKVTWIQEGTVQRAAIEY